MSAGRITPSAGEISDQWVEKFGRLITRDAVKIAFLHDLPSLRFRRRAEYCQDKQLLEKSVSNVKL